MIIEHLRSVTAILVMAHCAVIAGAAEPATAPQNAVSTQTSAPSAAPSPAAGKPLSASLGISVYPAKQQDAAKQSFDEYECHGWAKESSGYDPLNPSREEPVVAEEHKGGRVRGAVRGAAAGAVIGEVASNDAGKGAEIGAVTGVMRGGAQQRHAQQEAEKKAEAQTEEANAQRVNGFKKAFAACLQGRSYSVVM